MPLPLCKYRDCTVPTRCMISDRQPFQGCHLVLNADDSCKRCSVTHSPKHSQPQEWYTQDGCSHRKRQRQAASLGCAVSKGPNTRFKQAPHADAPAQAARHTLSLSPTHGAPQPGSSRCRNTRVLCKGLSCNVDAMLQDTHTCTCYWLRILRCQRFRVRRLRARLLLCAPVLARVGPCPAGRHGTRR